MSNWEQLKILGTIPIRLAWVPLSRSVPLRISRVSDPAQSYLVNFLSRCLYLAQSLLRGEDPRSVKDLVLEVGLTGTPKKKMGCPDLEGFGF